MIQKFKVKKNINMKLRGIITDYNNYDKSAMVILFPFCTFYDDGYDQFEYLLNKPIIDMTYNEIIDKYINDSATKIIVFRGLEPFDSPKDICELIKTFRLKTNDEIVIYTRYTEEESAWYIKYFKDWHIKNINIKFL